MSTILPHIIPYLWVALFALVCSLVSTGLDKLSPKLPSGLAWLAGFLSKVFQKLALQHPKSGKEALTDAEQAVEQVVEGK